MTPNNAPKIQSVCIYCGSSPGNDGAYVDAAIRLGENLAGNGIRLVYGGGDNGLMGAAARGALSRNGAVKGIIPQFLKAYEQRSGAVSLEGAEITVVPDMHTRKQQMFEESDAFVALPGGIGTLEELVEIMTWSQLGRHTKPIALLNTNGFWNPLGVLIEHMTEAGFLHNPNGARLRIAEQPDEIVPLLQGSAVENVV